jgi:hypothetical protein
MSDPLYEVYRSRINTAQRKKVYEEKKKIVEQKSSELEQLQKELGEAPPPEEVQVLENKMYPEVKSVKSVMTAIGDIVGIVHTFLDEIIKLSASWKTTTQDPSELVVRNEPELMCLQKFRQVMNEHHQDVIDSFIKDGVNKKKKGFFRKAPAN